MHRARSLSRGPTSPRKAHHHPSHCMRGLIVFGYAPATKIKVHGAGTTCRSLKTLGKLFAKALGRIERSDLTNRSSQPLADEKITKMKLESRKLKRKLAP